MFACKRLIGSSLFVFVLAGTVLTQEIRTTRLAPGEAVAPMPAGPLVTATATADRVRFVAPGTVIQVRLEVYNEAGQKVFDTELRGGNVLDWLLQDSAGQRLTVGSYASVLTVKSLSGRLSQRVGLVKVNEKTAALQGIGAIPLTGEQQQSIGPMESDAGFRVLGESEAAALTAVMHDGTTGQLNRTAGALSFRLGDFFSGTDTEQMRLTEVGNLGIGTEAPEFKLDVAGAVRARQGFVFGNGSSLNVNEKGALQLKDAGGELIPNASGAGTQGRLARWIDGAGTLGDSVVNDTGTALQLTAAPNGAFDTNLIYLNSTNGTTGVLAGSAPSYSANNGPFFAMRGNTYATIPSQRGIFTISAGNVGSPGPLEGVVKFNTGNNQVRMLITAAGNVGIGTTEPSFRLAVVDPSNAGLRVQTNVAGGAVASFGGNGDFQIDAPNVVGGRFAVKESGRVGIGTNSPLAALELRAGADSDGNGPSAMAFQWYLGGFRHWIRTRHNSVIGSGNAIDFFVNGSTTPEGSTGPGLGSGSQFVMTLDSGRVGIGTTSPGEILTVEGKIHSTFGGFKFPDGSVQTTAANATYTIGRTSNDSQILLTSELTSVLHLNLPAGTYLLTATLVLDNTADFFGQDNNRRISCRFSGDGPHDSTISIAGQAFATMPLHTVLSISSGGADVLCFGQTIASNTVYVFDRRLTAVRIENNVVVQ